jgi:sugar lactone lactonase YvrE
MTPVYDDTVCALGEGPLWHPGRAQLYWFDIIKHRLLTRESGKTRIVQFDEHVSAAGWVDDTSLLIASESRLFLFDLELETSRDIASLEADNRATRSNDGRADPWGGFWIGTMGKVAEQGAGAIYRFYRGELRKLYPNISISNAICFSPDRRFAYWTDTRVAAIMRQPLSAADGWPDGDAVAWLDLSGEGLSPDGAVVAAEGTLWNAQWGAWRVAAYSPDGKFLRAINVNAAHTSCPAFGGQELTTLFCTTAANGVSASDTARSAQHGMTFAFDGIAQGQAEHRVIL